MLAVSGIDHTIKIFSADGHARENAEKGIDVLTSNQRSSYGTSAPSSRARRQRQDDESNPFQEDGLSSRKRIDKMYQITSQNNAQRQGGLQEAYITVGPPFSRLTTTQMSFADWIAWIMANAPGDR